MQRAHSPFVPIALLNSSGQNSLFICTNFEISRFISNGECDINELLGIIQWEKLSISDTSVTICLLYDYNVK